MGTTHNHDLPAAGTLTESDNYATMNSTTSRGADVSGAQLRTFTNAGLVAATASTLTVTSATHGGRIVTLDRAAGIAVTLPVASGSGTRYWFILVTTVTSNTTTIKVPDASGTMTGVALILQDAADTVSAFETAGTTDTVTWNGTTTGGIKGDMVELIDIAANLWYVRVTNSGTGTEATPFSATV